MTEAFEVEGDLASDEVLDGLAANAEPSALPSEAERRLAEAKRAIVLAKGTLAKLQALLSGAKDLALPVRHGFIARADVLDELLEQALNCGLGEDSSENVIVATINRGLKEGVEPLANGHSLEIDPPAAQSPDEYGANDQIEPLATPLPPLTIDEWLSRDLPEPDFIMGDWLTTTTRALMYAPTGLGKSLKAMALGMHVAAGADFLHWRGRHACKVLYIDGEMSRRLLRQRIADEATRLGQRPPAFFALSHEDIEGFAPLNTPVGQACIESLIDRLGGVDFIIFDAIMCLLAGDPKENEPWAQTMPWVRKLTKRNIGQLWVHHTGHDASKGYGDKSREWQLDTVIALEPAASVETDVSFTLKFTKARERTPATRADFADTRISLVGDQWQTDAAAARKGNVSPLGQKFLGALQNVIGSDIATLRHGQRTVGVGAWRNECVRLGLVDPDKDHSARTTFSKHRRELIATNHIVCDDDFVWLAR